jgi:hypothetical protein
MQCVNSATAILDYLKSDEEQSALLLKWWLVLFYGFAAVCSGNDNLSVKCYNCFAGCRAVHRFMPPKS